MLPVFVINMDKDAERLAHMARQLDAAGIAFERIAAVNGRSLPQAELDGYRRYYNWSPGAIGCFLSHREAWRRAAESASAHSLVLEDDMFLSHDFASFVQDGAWMPPEAGIVRLETSTNRLKMVGEFSAPGEGRVCRAVRSTSWCAGAYIISRELASRLCEIEAAEWRPVDYFLFSHETSPLARTLSVYQVVPAAAVQGKYNEGSADLAHFKSNIESHVSAETLNRGYWARFKERPQLKSVMLYIYRTLAGYKRVEFMS